MQAERSSVDTRDPDGDNAPDVDRMFPMQIKRHMQKDSGVKI